MSEKDIAALLRQFQDAVIQDVQLWGKGPCPERTEAQIKVGRAFKAVVAAATRTTNDFQRGVEAALLQAADEADRRAATHGHYDGATLRNFAMWARRRARETPAPTPPPVADPGAVSATVWRKRALEAESALAGFRLRAEATSPVDLSALRESVRAFRADGGREWGPQRARSWDRVGALINAALALVDATPAEPVAAPTVWPDRCTLAGCDCDRSRPPQEPAEPVRAEACPDCGSTSGQCEDGLFEPFEEEEK